MVQPCHSDPSAAGKPSGLVRDTRGAVLVEYVLGFGLVAIVIALGLASLGPDVVRTYAGRRAALYQHSP